MGSQVRKPLKSLVASWFCTKGFLSTFKRQLWQNQKKCFLPLETKLRKVPDVPYGGYIQPQRGAQLFESLSFPFEKTAQSFANIFWPEGRPSFSETVKPISSGVVELAKNVKRMISESFGVEKYCDELLDEADYLLRLIKYEGPKADKAQGLEAHRDTTALTVLYQNHVDGLEAHRDTTALTILSQNGVDGLEVQACTKKQRLVQHQNVS